MASWLTFTFGSGAAVFVIVATPAALRSRWVVFAFAPVGAVRGAGAGFGLITIAGGGEVVAVATVAAAGFVLVVVLVVVVAVWAGEGAGPPTETEVVVEVEVVVAGGMVTGGATRRGLRATTTGAGGALRACHQFHAYGAATARPTTRTPKM